MRLGTFSPLLLTFPFSRQTEIAELSVLATDAGLDIMILATAGEEIDQMIRVVGVGHVAGATETDSKFYPIGQRGSVMQLDFAVTK